MSIYYDQGNLFRIVAWAKIVVIYYSKIAMQKKERM